MEASPVRVIQYFDGTKQSLIPLFQRPYTWSKKDWETLWKDVMAYYGADHGSTHFMGAIVSMPARTVPVGVVKHLVIDGQQRLTTLSLVIAALRDAMQGTPEEGRLHDFLVNRHYKGADHLKLVPTQGDREAYQKIVVDRALPVSLHRMKEAYEFFQGKIRGKDDEGQTIDPAKVLSVLEHSLQVVMINLGEADDPYLIFESLNYKGEPLTQGDLVRNYILMRFNHSLEPGGEQEQVYNQFWHPLETLLGGGLSEFLRHYVTRDGDEPTRGAIYTAVKKRLTGLDGAELQAELDTMLRHGEYFASFRDPSREQHEKVSKRLAAILELDATTPYPLMLRLFDHRANNRLDDDILERALGLVESFLLRRSVCGVVTNALNKLFAMWARNVPYSDAVGWLRAEIAKGEGSRRCPKDDEFLAKLSADDLYNKYVARFVLVRLERSFGSPEPASLDKATIEHIMPQTISDVWKAYLGTDFQRIFETWLHTLGNLTLSATNSELGNMPFDEKKAILRSSHIDLNRWIVDQEVWDEARMVERGKALAERARTLWPQP